ncbi:hypothetical protein DFJ74DRAFT_775739 [Hyaloraphidium curvatum]|nr:hypothetical protein DFJ74DRAFT_775739 [Hyaloraphidium curvatum]
MSGEQDRNAAENYRETLPTDHETAIGPGASPDASRSRDSDTLRIPPQIPRQTRSMLTDILAARRRYLEICADTLDTATAVANLALKRNNARAKAGKWAPGETEDEIGWEATAEELDAECRDTVDYLRDTAIAKLESLVARLELALKRILHLSTETSRNHGSIMVAERPVLGLFTLDALVGWAQSVTDSCSKDLRLRRSLANIHLAAVKTRQEAILYLAAWRHGPYLDDADDDLGGMADLIECAM